MLCLAPPNQHTTAPVCGLTPRSRGAPTARHQAPATGTLYIVCGRGLVSHRRRPLTSNVRHHKCGRAVREQSQRLRPALNSHKTAAPQDAREGPEWPILVTTPKTNYPAVALVQHTEVLRRTQSASPPGRSSLEVTECKFFTSPRPPQPQVRRLAARRLLKDAVREVLLRGVGRTAVRPPDRECRPLTQRPSAEAQCCLTLRSKGAPTAGHQARAGGTLYIFANPGLASCRWCPLSSNVRHRK